ncbi:MAG: TIGR04283 family arsenosugar biosynthesis glycosyltransferase [Methylophaga sp.]|nr:TIGR04283 family arsenosugar biosynthesis glycosyltransferase [Methylophaga sp.]
MAEISIIIPTYNEEVGIIIFLTKLQAFRPQCELILVDGGSDDDTVSLVEDLVDDVVRSDKGRALQMNVGAAMASAPILLFLHADTCLPSDAIETIQQSKDKGFSWGRFDIKLTGKSAVLSLVAWMMNKRSCLTGIATGDQALFVDKALFEQLDGFAEISLMEDIELSSRLKKHGKPYCIKKKVLSSGRRWLSFGVVKTVLLMWWLRLRYFFGANPTKLEQLYRKGRFWKV